jgi:hypothetical protein
VRWGESVQGVDTLYTYCTNPCLQIKSNQIQFPHISIQPNLEPRTRIREKKLKGWMQVSTNTLAGNRTPIRREQNDRTPKWDHTQPVLSTALFEPSQVRWGELVQGSWYSIYLLHQVLSPNQIQFPHISNLEPGTRIGEKKLKGWMQVSINTLAGNRTSIRCGQDKEQVVMSQRVYHTWSVLSTALFELHLARRGEVSRTRGADTLYFTCTN